MLTRDQILSVSLPLPREEVQVPEWGGSVHVRTMTAGERDRFEVQITETKRRDFSARLAVFTACDGEGTRLFGEGDVGFLTAQPPRVLARIVDVALRLNKVTEDEVAGLEKNSGSTPADAS